MLIVTAVMSGIAAILMLPVFEIVVPFMPPYIKFDFSDFPALFTGFAAGPLWGVLVCLIKNLIHIPMGTTGGIGEIANFVIGAVYVLTASLIHRKMKSRAGVIVGGIAGSFAMAAAAYPVNLFIVYPAYVAILHFPEEAIIAAYEAIMGSVAHVPTSNPLLNCLLIFNVTFTLCKGLLNVLISAFIYKPLSPLLHK